MKKRLLSVFLTLCMLLTLLPVTVSASTTTGNFIENPGGEIMTGGDQLTANGWNEDTSPVRGFSYPATDMGVTGYGGTHVMGFYCMGIPSSTASSCYQTFAVTSYTAGNTVSYTFSGLMTISVQGTGSGTATLSYIVRVNNMEDRIPVIALVRPELKIGHMPRGVLRKQLKIYIAPAGTDNRTAYFIKVRLGRKREWRGLVGSESYPPQGQ